VKNHLKDLMKVGTFSKQISNYSYPPLLYQRGDDSDEDEDGMDEFEDDDSPLEDPDDDNSQN